MPGTVTVACKLPNGLNLQLQRSYDVKEHTIYGPLETKRWERIGKVVQIAGWAHKIDQAPIAIIRNGFAFTPNVEADFFEEWMKQNADSDLVKGGFIYASAKLPDAEAHARDYRNERTGFERTDPHNLPDEFKRKIAPANAAA